MLGRSKPKKAEEATISRSDAVIDDTPVEGNLIKVKTPKAITLVGLPANETAFKVVREDDSGGKPPVVRRQKRSDPSPVLALTFPAGTDEINVMEAMQTYGLKGYRIEKNEEGVYRAVRSDLKSISSDAVEIKLNAQGLVATVARQDQPITNVGDKPHIALAALEFDSTKFDEKQVQSWVAEKSIDGTLEEQQNPDACYVVRRSEIAKDEETRRMVIEDGVTAVIVRADAYSVPDSVAVVSETAYGSWGWGQLDFMAAMSDMEFSEQMRSALTMLDDVLRNIILWSPLPLDVRKQLANRALEQFGAYVGSVMDSLPRQLLVASVARSANPNPPKENLMTQGAASGAATNTASADSNAANTQQTNEPAEKPLTRADVAQLVADGVAAALAKFQPQQAAAEPAKAEPAKTEAPLTRSDFQSMLTDALKGVDDKLKAVQDGMTVVRSAQEQVPEPKKEEPKTEQAMFRGAIFGADKRKARQ